MKVHGNDPSIQLEAYARKLDGQPSLKSETSGDLSVNRVDKVVLSPRAKEIHEATRQLGALPDVDFEKVDAVRSRMVSGTYKVDGRQIAEKMLKEMIQANLFLGS